MSKAGVQKIARMVVSDQVNAKVTLDLSKKYQEKISEYRAEIGTSLGRISSYISNLQTSADNYQMAASLIFDADIAEESSKLTANQILQRAAAGILSQANLQPRLVLKLLQDL